MISLFKVKIGISHVNIEETICNFSFISMDDFYNKTEVLQQFSDPHQNQFADPFKEMWKKLFATGAYTVLIFGGFIMLSFVKYEFQGQAAHYRTVLNQLNSWIFLMVSFYGLMMIFLILEEFLSCNPSWALQF